MHAFQTLAGLGMPLGIITNHTPEIRPVIEATLGGYVEPKNIVISGEEGIYKPDRSIFLNAAARLGLPAKQCLYIGDNLEVDAMGAVASGFAGGIWCDRSGLPPSENLPPNVYRITELGQILPSISGYQHGN